MHGRKKIISICTAPKTSKEKFIEYRFESSGESKFVFRADKNQGNHIFNRVDLLGASTASTVLWFENQGYFYMVNDPVKGIPSLVVQKGKIEISTTECTGNIEINLNSENQYIKKLDRDAYFNLFE